MEKGNIMHFPVTCYSLYHKAPSKLSNFISISDRPIVTVESSHKTVTEGDDVTLTCLASSKPAATFTWSKTSINDPIVTRNGTSDEDKFCIYHT